MPLEQLTESKSFNGRQLRFRHHSEVLHCSMQFSIYLPPLSEGQVAPVLYWLSGLTCNDENFVHKAGAQRVSSELGLIVVSPDTSPRGEGVPDDPEAAYDLGLGAGFYVDAIQSPWAQNYQMYSYVTQELYHLVTDNFPVATNRQSIFGHSMGGHGALTIALKNPHRYKSVSAFAPICAPMRCPRGQKALLAYLGEHRDQWQHYDATELLSNATDRLPVLIDQGSADQFLDLQLLPELLRQAAAEADYPIEFKLRPGYDHSYHYIATFIEEHLRFHHRYLIGD